MNQFKKNKDEKMKKPMSRSKLIIISIIASIALWVVIVQTVNPNVSYTITDVPVKILGEGTLRDRGIVVMNADEIPKFSVKVSGNRNDVLMAIDRVRINFDVSQFTQLGEFAVTPSVYAPQSINVESQNLNNVMLQFEECVTKEIPISTEYTGLSKNKVIEITPKINKVTVSGAVSEMASLATCLITVDASEIKNTYTDMYTFIYANENGSKLEKQKTLFCNTVAVEAESKIYDKVEFSYEIEIADSMKDKYRIDIEKESLAEYIAGGMKKEEGSMPTLTYIIPSDEYENGRQEFNATLEENSDVFVPQKELKVFANVTKLKTKKVNISIEVINKADNITIECPSNLTIDLIMPEEIDVDLNHIKGYVDVADKTPGEYSIPITFENSEISAKDPDIDVSVRALENNG